jgi:hypothetical protein
LESGITSLVRNIAEDASATYFITKNIFCECCGMQLRSAPAERECKEKLLNRKIKRKRESGMMRL